MSARIRANIDGVYRAELPIRPLIVPGSSIESAFASTRRRMRPACTRDAQVLMRDLLAEWARDRSHALMLACLRKPHQTRLVSLERAAQRMHDVDLDSAWRAALRGDEAVLRDRLAPHVTAPPKRPPKGSPWRSSGWLTRRATGR